MSDNYGNPWKTLSSRIAYENPWIKVREDQVIRPDGSPGIYGVVQTRIATGVVALDDQLHVYLVGQYRYATGNYSWEIIEGGSERGEDPAKAIQRELAEEAGLRAAQWVQLGAEFHLSNCHSDERALIYFTTGLEHVEASPEVTEVLEVKRVAFADALAMVHDGSITDAMSIVGLLRAERYLRERGALE